MKKIAIFCIIVVTMSTTCFAKDCLMEHAFDKNSVMEKLVEGFRSFQKTWCISKNKELQFLKEGQNPRALVIACSDSRVDPAILTDAKPGDLFVVRNVANLVPPYEKSDDAYHGVSAAMEYAVLHLKVDAIIVLGHAGCGGIQSLMQRSDDYIKNGFIDHWMDIAKPAKITVNKELPNASTAVRQKAAENLSIQYSLNNLMTFPWIKKAVAEGKLKLYGWYFDIATGELSQFNPSNKTFTTLVPACKFKN